MNITTSFAEMMGYLARLGELHPRIKSVIVGNSAQIITLDRSTLKYPVLWIETPEVSWDLGVHPKRFYNIHFLVLYNTQVDTWTHEQHVLHNALEITEDLLVKIRQDAEENLLVLKDGRASSQPVLGYGHDHDYGYRTSIRPQAYMKSCAPPCVWVDACPLGSLARFTWANDNLGGFTNITFTDASLPANENWTVLWTWEVDDNGMSMDENPPPANLGEGHYLYVTLTLTLGDCTLYASKLIYADNPCGESVPAIIEKKYG